MNLFPCALVFGLVFVFAVNVNAQTDQDVLQKNKQAMEAYGNLEIDEAMTLLNDAEQLCLDNNITGAQLARTYVNIGMVEFGANGDAGKAMTAFKKAVCQDSTVMLDPLNSTPEMDALFTEAKSQMNADGCEGMGGPAPTADSDTDGAGMSDVDDLLGITAATPIPTPEPAGPTVPATTDVGSSQRIVNDVLEHNTVVEQSRLVPIPFYVVTNPDAEVGSVVLFYRTQGERIFQQLQLVFKEKGWSANIQCDVLSTLDPSAIEYYIAVMDESGQLLSTAGSEAQPFQMVISPTASVPPRPIPGEEPLPACQAECPPWNPDCNDTGCKKYAALCSESEPCCSGMACVDGVCEEGGSSESSSFVNTKGSNTKVRFYVNAGTGLGLIGKGTFTKDDFPNMRGTTGVRTSKTAVALSKLHLRVGAMYSLTEKFELGLNFRGDLPLFSPHYSVITPSVVVNAAYRIAGNSAEKGFQMFGVIGFGWLNIMQRVPFEDCFDFHEDENGNEVCTHEDWQQRDGGKMSTNGFRKAGNLGAEFGFDMNYWFARNIGINVGTIFDVLFPEFTINLDLQMGLALRF